MGHSSLEIDTSRLPDILDDESYQKALDGFLDFANKLINKLFNNALEKNFNEWQANVPPIQIEGYFESIMPNDIGAILNQKV
jgi:hypothetical protein